MNVPCHFCGDPVRIGSRLTFQKAEGWVQSRKRGGVNHLAVKELREEWACTPCIDKLRRGVSPGQRSLI